MPRKTLRRSVPVITEVEDRPEGMCFSVVVDIPPNSRRIGIVAEASRTRKGRSRSVGIKAAAVAEVVDD